MALAFQDGGLIFSGGGLGQHPACCCKPPPAPAGPMCGCSLFSSCTTTVEYDGLVIVFSSGGGGSSGVRQRAAGRQCYREDGLPRVVWCAELTRFLSVSACQSRSQVQAVFFDTCVTQTSSTGHHFVVSVGDVVGVFNDSLFPVPSKRFFQQAFAYKYELDLGPSSPCPATLAGRSVTVRQVASINNGCNSSCETFRNDVKNYLFPPVGIFHSATKFTPFVWRTYPGGQPTPPVIEEPADDDSWFCSHPIWQAPTPPSVSIACAP